MNIQLRTASLEDVSFLVDVVIKAIRTRGRFTGDFDEAAYRAGYEDWTRETVMGNIPDCTLSVIEQDGVPIGRLRVLRDGTCIILAGIQLLPEYQNRHIGTDLVEQLKREANLQSVPLRISVEKDNPNAQRFYARLGCVVVGQDKKEYHLEYRPQ